MRGSRHTTTIGPPLLAFAWERVAAASADEPGFATESLHALEAHLDWLERERDVDGDGLITIILPDESGLDDSPKYDPVYGAHAHYKPGYFRWWRATAAWDGARTRSRRSTTSTSRSVGERRLPSLPPSPAPPPRTSRRSGPASTCGARGAGRRG